LITQYKPTEKDANIISDITTHISNSLEGWYGAGTTLESWNPQILSYRNSFMLRYPITTAQTRNILVKIRRKPKMTSLTQAIQADIHQNVPGEYEALKFAFLKFDQTQEDFGVIRPLSYIAKDFAIVMEEFPSRTLRQLLDAQRSFHTSRSLCDLKDAAIKTGQWLGYFHHQIHTASEMPYTTDDILNEVQLYAERLEYYSHGRIRAYDIQKAFSRGLANIHLERVTFSQSHADMSCDNVLYSANHKLCVIDIKTRLAPIYADLGLVLIHPETFKLQILSGGRYYSESLLNQYRANIIEGYFNHQPGNEILVRISSAIKILDKWLMYEELMSKYKGIKQFLALPAGPLVSSYFHHLLNKYFSLIEEGDIQHGSDPFEITDRPIKSQL
jgi:hypothetical protein